MSTLTVALASLGGVVLAGVIAHGAWQARRAGPRRASTQREEPVASERLEPGSGTGSTNVDGDGDGQADPVLTLDGAPVGTRRLARRTVPALDPLIDAFATFSIDQSLGGDAIAPHLPSKRHAGSKAVFVEGLDAHTQQWEPVQADHRYAELQAGVQLASRTGPLNEIEYSEFVQRFQVVAEALGASAEFPDMLEVMARARELDAFAGQHDAQLAVHLKARGAAWSVGYVQQHARQHGFVPGVVAGRLVRAAAEEGDPPVLTLTFDPRAALADEPDRAAVRDVTLAFDVPQTDASLRPFAAWQQAAQALAAGMDADLVDDEGRALAPASFESIGNELEKLYTTLAEHDLAAGSPAARRLFS